MTTTAISISQTSKDQDGSLSDLEESILTQQVDKKATTITGLLKNHSYAALTSYRRKLTNYEKNVKNPSKTLQR